ncbi:putative glycosyl transferase, group 2 family domain-containing protein [Neospora caninum Liverpool]|uniref:Glycosyl transferase, group 2 family domain-containing protein, putative n=1 Tax=Neospora caninum (strain Liverpool) TaxID=572307 RepID=F0VBN0_NEOCL|nr:putative glycosyl transferase, group 2 family domain-containing protein [Neospora caninum Liverpool]CBZ51014.1 putative glycosyl transferase, group 2 family domain-containing protein [Neospora caninum Liverpool]CEL68319.1 TPA: glycosyl transferase, group 2 family domain-containing protein, putative [Neospora caninum Liverpool]|eukprot:XP_003881047.1 putative glycosyl transferase, group 2 family domain-containing protein [Neospora caninum Liverpool]
MELPHVSDLLHLDPHDTQCPRWPRILYRSPLYSTLGIPLPCLSPSFSNLSSSSSSSSSASTSSSSSASSSSECRSLATPASSTVDRSSQETGAIPGTRVTVSVIITAKNAGPFIEAAVESLLAQTYVRRRQLREAARIQEDAPPPSPVLLSPPGEPAMRRGPENAGESGLQLGDDRQGEQLSLTPEPGDAQSLEKGGVERAKKMRYSPREEAPNEAKHKPVERLAGTSSRGDRSPRSEECLAVHPQPRAVLKTHAASCQSLTCAPPHPSPSSGAASPLLAPDSPTVPTSHSHASSESPSPSRLLSSVTPLGSSPDTTFSSPCSTSRTASARPTPDPVVSPPSPSSDAASPLTSGDSLTPLEICIFDDGSTDSTLDVLLGSLAPKCFAKRVLLTVAASPSASSSESGGVGYGRNQAVRVSSGDFLCFMDADDEALPERIELQLREARRRPKAIVGCGFVRHPPQSTGRYTHWLNTLSDAQLITSRFRECTLLMPTWFMPRAVFERVGGFVEGRNLRFLQPFQSESRAQTAARKGFGGGDPRQPAALPEDLLFLYRHVREGGDLVRLPAPLYVYKYHEKCTSFTVSSDLLWELRIHEFQRQVMESLHRPWIIWSVGRDGKRFYRSLSVENKRRVMAFVDIDPKKVARGAYVDSFPPLKGRKIPIYFWEAARTLQSPSEQKPIFVVCVKYEMPPLNSLEQKLDMLGMKEGEDFFFFC